MGKDDLASRFTACLLGGAVGDALGAAVEFNSHEEIQARFGSKGIRDFIECYGKVGAITDDTQMTLFTAEGLLQAEHRWAVRGICHIPSVVAYAYLNWLSTQKGVNSHIEHRYESQLLEVSDLHAQRAPGSTCLSALESMLSAGEPAVNNSKGCGGVMRVAPVGLIAARLFDAGSAADWAYRQANDICAITHGHPSGQFAGGALAVIIASIVGGSDLNTAIDLAETHLTSSEGAHEVLTAIKQAKASASSRPDEIPIPLELGEGWVAEEALAISIYCCLSYGSYEEAVIAAVNHSGDSDSTGSITGNILGALYGIDAIPERFLAKLELRSTIEELAKNLMNPPETGFSGMF